MSGQIYDPRKKFDEENDATKSVVWNSQNVQWGADALSVGQPLMKSPFHENDPALKKRRLVFAPTKFEMLEMSKCLINPMFFVNNYGKLKQKDSTYQLCKLYDYQRKQFLDYLRYGKHIQAWSRQASKTTTAALYILWNVTFNINRQCAILSNKQKTSNEVLDKIKELYRELPFFMKAGIVLWNDKFVSFDNGCSILAAPCTKDAINGKTIHTLYIDEFAFCFDGDKEKQNEFLANAVPVMAQVEDPRLIITSTPNGKDLFYELYDQSVKGKKSYLPSTVYWWQIPGRDRKWAEDMIGTIGLEKFKIQFEMSFDVTLNKLLSSVTMRELSEKSVEFVNYDFEKYFGDYAKYLRVNPSSRKLKDKFYVVLIDLAEGLGGDSTTAHFVSINHRESESGFGCKLYFKQEFVLESNDVPLESEFPNLLLRVVRHFTDSERCRFIIENNTYGDYFMTQINVEMENLNYFVYPASFLRYAERNGARNGKRRLGGRRVGIRTNRSIKKHSVNSFKLCMENGVIDISDSKTINQVGHFQQDKRGNYKAEVGHDDNVTPYLHLCYTIMKRQNGFIALIDNYLTSKGLDVNKWDFDYNFDELRRRLDFND
tara:strand:- start:6349 stop:8148 length:1800 start_codon:yes stop_codon:yes gene_type:complete